jgi:malate synthase
MMEFLSESLLVQVHAPPSDAAKAILTPDALRLIGVLHSTFAGRREALLEKRRCRQAEFDAGLVPQFLPPSPATKGDWKCAPIPTDIQDRRVEITGPVDRKMVINGLNSGANVYMAGQCWCYCWCCAGEGVIDSSNVTFVHRRNLGNSLGLLVRHMYCYRF